MAFKEEFNSELNKPFENDIRCIAHIINLIAQDILKEFTSNSKTEEFLKKYIRDQDQALSTDNTTKNSKFLLILTNYIYILNTT